MNKHFIIPRHLVERPIPKLNSNPLQKFSEIYPVKKLGDITIEHLTRCYFENQILFLKVIKQMAFFGVPFFKNFKCHSIIESPENTKYLWIESKFRGIPFNPIMPEYLINTFKNNGLFYKGDFVGIPIDSFFSIDKTFPFVNFFTEYGFMILEYSEFIKDELEGNSEIMEKVEDGVPLKVDGREIWLPSSNAEKSILKEDFPNSQKLIQGLWNMGYKKWGALPLELDNLLFQIKGTGSISIKKFADRLEYLLANDAFFADYKFQLQGTCKVPSIKTVDDLTKIKYLITKERVVIIPDVLLDEKLSVDRFPKSNILIRELLDKGIIYYKDMPSDLYKFCMSLDNIGKASVRKFIDTLISECKAFYQEGEMFVQPMIPFKFNGNSIYIPKLFCELSLKEITNQNSKLDQLVNILSDAGYSKILDFPTDLTKLPGNNLHLYELFDTICEIFGLFDSSFRYSLSQLICMLKKLIPEKDLKPECINERGWELWLIKYNLIRCGQKATLEILGESIGVTRERARQILSISNRKIADLYDAAFSKVANMLVRSRKIIGAGVCFPIEELKEFPLFILKELLYCKGIYYLDKNDTITILNSGEIEELNEQFKTYIINEVGHLVLPEDKLTQIIKSFLVYYNFDSSTYNYFYNLAVQDVLTLNDDRSKYILRNLNKNEIALMALKEFPYGLAVYKEADVLREKLNLYGKDLFENDRSLIATLVREPDKALLWGWGVYIHKDYVNINPNNLSIVIKWIEEQFDKGISQISSHAAFTHFKEMLEEIGIPNEHALYSCIRLFYKDKFYMPKSPKIFPLGQIENNTNKEMLDQFILDFGKSGCTLKQLEEEFIKKRGWKEYTLQQSVSNSDDIIRIGPASFGVLESYDDISNDDLEPLVVFLKNKLADDLPFVSISLLFKNKKATCLSLGIKTEELLYYLIKKRFGVYFDFPRWPHVCLKNGNQEYINSSYREQVEEFLLDQNVSMFREELRNEFIDRRGWDQLALDNALTCSRFIYQLERGTNAEFVHKKVVGWNDVKQNQLEKWVKDKIEEYKLLDPPYGNVERVLLQINQLPPLDNNIIWTAELLKCLLENCPFIEFIGTKKSLFVPIYNQAGIENDVDFLEDILWKEFNGAAKLSEFKQVLNKLDFSYRGEIPKAYQGDLSDDLPYYILGDEIISKNL